MSKTETHTPKNTPVGIELISEHVLNFEGSYISASVKVLIHFNWKFVLFICLLDLSDQCPPPLEAYAHEYKFASTNNGIPVRTLYTRAVGFQISILKQGPNKK